MPILGTWNMGAQNQSSEKNFWKNMLSLHFATHNKFMISFVSFQKLNKKYENVHPRKVRMNVKKNGKIHCDAVLKPHKDCIALQFSELSQPYKTFRTSLAI